MPSELWLRGNDGEANPVTLIQNDVFADVKGDEDVDSIVEFEDINFDVITGSGGVCVIQAKRVAFRRCRFHGSAFGAGVGLNRELFTHNEFCHATFESCLFEGNPQGDILVRELSHVTMINCVLRGPALCVEVLDFGRFTAIHCTFQGSVHALDKVPLFELVNCSVVDCAEQGIHIGNGTTARLLGCRVARCGGEGIVGKGPRRLTAHIEDCVVTECRIGYIFDLGKIDVIMRNSAAFNNGFHGLHLCPTVTGSIAVEKCKFTDNHGSMNVCITSGPDCKVIIDGVPQQMGYDAENWNLVQEDLKRLFTENKEDITPIRLTLKQRRAEKQVLFGRIEDICCLHCHKPEPKNVKFKACGKCNEVVYCSRECQVAHWKEHKKECGK